MITSNPILEAQRANVLTCFALTAKALEGLEKFTRLNLQVSRAALAEAGETAQSLLKVTDSEELVAQQASLFQILNEKTAAYSRELHEIISATRGEFGKVLESQFGDALKQMLDRVDVAAKNAPPGSDSAVSVFRTAVSSGVSAVQSMQNALRGMSETAGADFDAASR